MKGKFSFSIKYTLEIIIAEVHYHLIILFPNGSKLFIDDHNILFADWKPNKSMFTQMNSIFLLNLKHS
jgi:hypothetical protein